MCRLVFNTIHKPRLNNPGRSEAPLARPDSIDDLKEAVPGPNRRLSSTEGLEDDLCGQLHVPVFEEPGSGVDGLQAMPHTEDPKPAPAARDVPLYQMSSLNQSDSVSDTDSECSESSDDAADDSPICRVGALLSRVGLGADLASLYRMPLMMYKYGVCFLFVYFVLAGVSALPLFYLEMSLGQFSSRGPCEAWNFAPIFKGVGRGMLLLAALIAVYISVLTSWSLAFLFSSLYRQVPWSNCSPEWRINNCRNSLHNDSLQNLSASSFSSTGNSSFFQPISPPQAYFRYSAGVELDSELATGTFNWQLSVALLAVWAIVGFLFTRRISYRSKVFNALALALMFFLFLFVIIGVLYGKLTAQTGVKYSWTHSWDSFHRPQIWLDAFGQLVISLGVCSASALTYGSRMKFRHNIYRDVVLKFISKLFWSLLTSILVLFMSGIIAHENNVPVSKAFGQGPDLGIFLVAVSKASLLLPEPSVWSTLFFCLLTCVSIKQLCFWVEPIVRSPLEANPTRWRRRRLLVVTCVCLILFMTSLVLTSPFGFRLLTELDFHLPLWSALVFGAIQTLVLCWVYGLGKWLSNMEVMVDTKPASVWQHAWKFVTPIAHAVLFLVAVVYLSLGEPGRDTPASWLTYSALLVCWSPIILALASFAMDLYRWQPLSQKSRWSPAISWGPVKEAHRWATYGVTFVAPEPILMVHVDSILRPDHYGGVPHGYYLLPSDKDPENNEILRQQENLRKALQRRLMAKKQSAIAERSSAPRRLQVVIEQSQTSSGSSSESTVSTPQSTLCMGDERRRSVMEQAAVLRRQLEDGALPFDPAKRMSAFTSLGSDQESTNFRRHSCFFGASTGQYLRRSAGPLSLDPRLLSDRSRISRQSACPAVGFTSFPLHTQPEESRDSIHIEPE